MRRKRRLIFPAQNIGNLDRKASKDGAIGVHHMPFALIQIDFRQMRLHQNLLKRAEKIAKDSLKSTTSPIFFRFIFSENAP
jgi:hypothetical protein